MSKSLKASGNCRFSLGSLARSLGVGRYHCINGGAPFSYVINRAARRRASERGYQPKWTERERERERERKRGIHQGGLFPKTSYAAVESSDRTKILSVLTELIADHSTQTADT